MEETSGVSRLRLWGRPDSINVQKVLWTLAELDLAFENTHVGGPHGQLDTPQYGALNPNRRIPTLQDGDLVAWESNAIVRYVSARYGAGTLWPDDPADRARADIWMDWAATTVMPDMLTLFFNLIRNPAPVPDRAAVDRALASLGTTLGVLDRALEQAEYVAGPSFTMGDIPLGVTLRRLKHWQIELPETPGINRWLFRLQDRGAFQRHVTP